MGTAPTETNEAALLTRPGGQLYAVLGQPVTSDDGSVDRYPDPPVVESRSCGGSGSAGR